MSTMSRVTHRTLQQSTMASLQRNLAALTQLGQQISSGKRISKPSDDPTGAVNALQLKSEQANNTQYGQNADDGIAWLSASDTALASTTSQLRRARDIVVAALNTGTQNAGTGAANGAEIDGIKGAVLGLANSQYLGRSIFAGTVGGSAFTATTTAGVTGYDTAQPATGTVTRQVGPDESVRVDTSGAAVFGAETVNGAATGDTSVFKLLDQISAKIKDPASAGDLSAMLGQLDARLTTINTAQTDVGGRYNQVSNAKDAVLDRSVSLATTLSSVQDTDIASAAINLQMQQTAYQAALQVTAKVSQTSLLDFLR